MHTILQSAFAAALAFCVGVAASSSSARTASSITNGGFESPVVTPGTFQNFATGGDIDGWTVVGPQASVVSGTFIQNGISFLAHDGDQWLDLTGFNANSSEGVEQSVSTVAGKTYKVTFWVGNVLNPGGLFGTSSTVDAFVDGAKKLTATNTDGTTQQIWKEFSFTFTAAGSSTAVKLLNADPASDNANGLDDVSIEETSGPPPSVPLPPAAYSGLALMATLLVGKVVIRRFTK